MARAGPPGRSVGRSGPGVCLTGPRRDPGVWPSSPPSSGDRSGCTVRPGCPQDRTLCAPSLVQMGGWAKQEAGIPTGALPRWGPAVLQGVHPGVGLGLLSGSPAEAMGLGTPPARAASGLCSGIWSGCPGKRGGGSWHWAQEAFLPRED